MEDAAIREGIRRALLVTNPESSLAKNRSAEASIQSSFGKHRNQFNPKPRLHFLAERFASHHSQATFPTRIRHARRVMVGEI